MIGFVGGTGSEGKGLALRFALGGEDVFVGSRDANRSDAVAAEIATYSPVGEIFSGLNQDAAREADVIFLTIPFDFHASVIKSLEPELRGKIVVDVSVPMRFCEKEIFAIEVDDGSAAEQAQVLLPGSKIVGAFHTVSAIDLLVHDRLLNSDVIVCSEDEYAKNVVMQLAELIQGVRAVDGGNLSNAAFLEKFTVLLIKINRIYKAHSSIKLVGI
ncbi:MAG: NADPH-dependent F420 reductase [Chloroflexota bacterium]|nr:NADPH-dependent F420 reductase [Chloroflexota bacterium]